VDDRARALLQDANHAVVVTLRGDGSTHSVVVWAEADGDGLSLNTAEGRDWLANVRRDPRIEVLVANRENPYEYVTFRGRVAETTHDGAEEQIDRLAKKYLDQDTYPFRRPGEQRVRLVVAPEQVQVVAAG
jgi:PPOX class probable F420-dependent enzyme